MSQLQFPKGFLWGASSSAYQTEGNNTNSDWWDWEKSKIRINQLKSENKNIEEYLSGVACDSFKRFNEDFSLAKKLGHNANRLSIEWARIEPESGKFNSKGLDHYKAVLQSAKKNGLSTFVTLHHFTNPLWFSRLGGFANKRNINLFVRYCLYIVKELDPYVDFWITINEPEVYTYNAYISGRFPPQKKNILVAFSVTNNLISAHIDSYNEMKTITKKPISIAYRLSAYNGIGIGGLGIAKILTFANNYVLRHTVRKCDFIGLNYYTNYFVSIMGLRNYPGMQLEKSDMGWGIDPKGLETILLDLKKYNKSIYITENGIADKKDSMRWQFIKEHLKSLHSAVHKGVDVRGYLYWALTDNFEWDKGFSPQFGLIEIKRNDRFKRNVRNSAYQYQKVCKSNLLSTDQ